MSDGVAAGLVLIGFLKHSFNTGQLQNISRSEEAQNQQRSACPFRGNVPRGRFPPESKRVGRSISADESGARPGGQPMPKRQSALLTAQTARTQRQGSDRAATGLQQQQQQGPGDDDDDVGEGTGQRGNASSGRLISTIS